MKKKIFAMIPARIGSQRLKLKNLSLLNGKPLIYYAIQSAKDSHVFDSIYINSDDKIFKKIAKRYDVNFYERKKIFGSSNTKSDTVVYDFMKNCPKHDILVWVNSIAPLQTYSEIKKIVNFFIKNNLDSLITVENKKVHCNFNNRPLNYSRKSKFAKTQDLKVIQNFVYSLMIWKKKTFIKKFEKNKSAILCGKTFFYPVKNLSTIIIKDINDLKLANYIVKNKSTKFILKYDKIVKKNFLRKK